MRNCDSFSTNVINILSMVFEWNAIMYGELFGCGEGCVRVLKFWCDCVNFRLTFEGVFDGWSDVRII